MALEIIPFILGPIENNTYLVIDGNTKQASIVDPSFDSIKVLKYAREHDYQITQIWCTHAHFDHIVGINDVMSQINPTPSVFLHPDDLPLWNSHGGAKMFGVPFEVKFQPSNLLKDKDAFNLGLSKIQTSITPGHTKGHVIYYIPDAKVVFCGDLIFRMSVGRTDLPGGNQLELLQSIDNVIKVLPEETRLLSGHGPETTVGYEKKYNPFL